MQKKIYLVGESLKKYGLIQQRAKIVLHTFQTALNLVNH